MTNFDIPFYKNRERKRCFLALFSQIYSKRQREKIKFLKVIGISEVAGTKQNSRISLQILHKYSHDVDQHTFCKILSISQKQRTQMTYDFLPEKQISLETFFFFAGDSMVISGRHVNSRPPRHKGVIQVKSLVLALAHSQYILGNSKISQWIRILYAILILPQSKI